MLIGVGTVAQNRTEKEKFDILVKQLKRDNIELTSLNEDLFQQIYKTAERRELPSRLHLKACRKIGRVVECAFNLPSILPLNIYLDRGTRFVDENGTEHYAALSVTGYPRSDYGYVSVGPGGVVVQGPTIFVIKFPDVGSVEKIARLEMLASEKEGLIVYQFRDIPLSRAR